MDVREKLVELLDIIIQPGQKTLGDIADYFIANGVTVQECGYWVSVTDCANAKIDALIYENRIAYWIPLPLPPKGE